MCQYARRVRQVPICKICADIRGYGRLFAGREDIDMCSRCDIFVLTLIAHISLYLTDTLSVLREYLNILRIPPEFSAVQCISFFRFGRVSYYAFHTYHTNIGNILLDIEKILYMLPRIAKISHIGGKVTPELGGNRSVIRCRQVHAGGWYKVTLVLAEKSPRLFQDTRHVASGDNYGTLFSTHPRRLISRTHYFSVLVVSLEVSR